MPHRTAPTAPALRLALAALVVGALAATAAGADELELTLDPAKTKVTFELPATGHDVHGLARLTSASVRFDPATGAAAGEVVVDATTAATGNGSRDRTMREEVLEIAKFPRIVFAAERLEGAVAAEGASEVKLHGTIDLHGAKHPLVLPAKIELHGGRLAGTASFPVPYQAWGLHDPSIAFLRVADTVVVKIELAGQLAPVAAAAAAR